LQTIGGGYLIANNSALLIVDGFEALKTVVGALDFSGNFTNVTLPALSDVRGGFNLETSATFDCSPFKTDHDNSVIKGTFFCSGSQANPHSGTTGGTGTSTATGTAASPTKTGSAGRFEIDRAIVVGLASVVGIVLHFSV